MNIQRPTPETDALTKLYANADPARARDAVTDSHRNLERQRDELAVKLVANEAYQSGILSERDEAIRDLEQGFMQGTYARLKQLQDRERDYFAMFQQLEAMREAVKEAHGFITSLEYEGNEKGTRCISCCSHCSESHRQDCALQSTLAKLQPFLKP